MTLFKSSFPLPGAQPAHPILQPAFDADYNPGMLARYCDSMMPRSRAQAPPSHWQGQMAVPSYIEYSTRDRGIM